VIPLFWRNFKKIAATVLCLLTVAAVFSSCAKRDQAVKQNLADKLSKGFSLTADIAYGGNSYQVKFERSSSGVSKMVFVKPDQLSSLSMTLSEDLKINYGDIEATVSPESLSETALFYSMLNTFSACLDPDGFNVKHSKASYLLTGKTPAGNFTLTLGSNIIPEKLEIPAQNLVITFSDFKYT
jgi:hypothetical protein